MHDLVVEAVRRLAEFQNAAYAGRYLDRLEAIMDAEKSAGGDLTLTRETGRLLALWMAYQDVIRVADILRQGWLQNKTQRSQHKQAALAQQKRAKFRAQG